jgi:cytochrome bd-type quinol oxidase subunit 1
MGIMGCCRAWAEGRTERKREGKGYVRALVWDTGVGMSCFALCWVLVVDEFTRQPWHSFVQIHEVVSYGND